MVNVLVLGRTTVRGVEGVVGLPPPPVLVFRAVELSGLAGWDGCGVSSLFFLVHGGEEDTSTGEPAVSAPFTSLLEPLPLRQRLRGFSSVAGRGVGTPFVSRFHVIPLPSPLPPPPQVAGRQEKENDRPVGDTVEVDCEAGRGETGNVALE